MDLEVSEIKEHCAQKSEIKEQCAQKFPTSKSIGSVVSSFIDQWSLIMGSEVHRSKIIGSKGS